MPRLGYIPVPVPGAVKLAELTPDGLVGVDESVPEPPVLVLRGE
jgi:hypothetical protein